LDARRSPCRIRSPKTPGVLQGADSAFAFIDAVFLATQGLPAYRFATPIGVTLSMGMPGGSVGQIGVSPLVKGLVTVPTFWYLAGRVSGFSSSTVIDAGHFACRVQRPTVIFN
jgi:hypothetical protein